MATEPSLFKGLHHKVKKLTDRLALGGALTLQLVRQAGEDSAA